MTIYGESVSSLSYDILAADTEARAEVVKDKFHITAIYGWHENEEDADELVEIIAANSIVFVEGHMRDPEYAKWRLSQHTVLADMRLSQGAYGSVHGEEGETLASEFLRRQHSAPTEHDLHSYSLYRGLLDKGCVILPSDYLNFGDNTPQLANLEDLRAKLHSEFPITTDKALESVIAVEVELLDMWLGNNEIRETGATNLVLHFLSRYSQAPYIGSMAKATDGRVQAYIVYGLAHRDSLTSRFKAYGISLEQMFVNSRDMTVDELRNIATELALSPTERADMIRNHYLGMLAASQHSQEL
jgi:hypothetical protein